MSSFVNVRCGRCKRDVGCFPAGACVMCHQHKLLAETRRARPAAEWAEEDGAVLWWRFPIEEPPYCGTPLDDDWPGYHTHWTITPEPDTP